MRILFPPAVVISQAPQTPSPQHRLTSVSYTHLNAALYLVYAVYLPRPDGNFHNKLIVVRVFYKLRLKHLDIATRI